MKIFIKDDDRCILLVICNSYDCNIYIILNIRNI